MALCWVLVAARRPRCFVACTCQVAPVSVSFAAPLSLCICWSAFLLSLGLGPTLTQDDLIWRPYLNCNSKHTHSKSGCVQRFWVHVFFGGGGCGVTMQLTAGVMASPSWQVLTLMVFVSFLLLSHTRNTGFDHCYPTIVLDKSKQSIDPHKNKTFHRLSLLFNYF